MNDLNRFKAVVNFGETDYIPIFAFAWSPGVSWGLWEPDRQRLVEEGMPEWVGKCNYENEKFKDEDQYSCYLRTGAYKSWMKYWGTTGPNMIDIDPFYSAKKFKTTSRIEGEFEIIESETGAVTKQVLNNETTYSMPHFEIFDVRDRVSWYFYRDAMTPKEKIKTSDIKQQVNKYSDRIKPLQISGGGTWGGFLRNVMGPEKALTILYDDPKLVYEMMEWNLWRTKEYIFPLIEALRPEIVGLGEDICYNHGMLISPAHFDEFCSDYYKQVYEVSEASGADLLAVDSDGNCMEFVDVITNYGVNGLHPFEVKAGNDLAKIRQKHKKFIMFGGLEKEVLNIGNTDQINKEVISKVTPLLEYGGFFPNADHGIQPLATFDNLCRFMTILHDILNNPEGEFPRIQ